jgi:hypothetical protein
LKKKCTLVRLTSQFEPYRKDAKEQSFFASWTRKLGSSRLLEEFPIVDAEDFAELSRHSLADRAPIILDRGEVRIFRSDSTGELDEGKPQPAA